MKTPQQTDEQLRALGDFRAAWNFVADAISCHVGRLQPSDLARTRSCEEVRQRGWAPEVASGMVTQMEKRAAGSGDPKEALYILLLLIDVMMDTGRALSPPLLSARTWFKYRKALAAGALDMMPAPESDYIRASVINAVREAMEKLLEERAEAERQAVSQEAAGAEAGKGAQQGARKAVRGGPRRSPTQKQPQPWDCPRGARFVLTGSKTRLIFGEADHALAIKRDGDTRRMLDCLVDRKNRAKSEDMVTDFRGKESKTKPWHRVRDANRDLHNKIRRAFGKDLGIPPDIICGAKGLYCSRIPISSE